MANFRILQLVAIAAFCIAPAAAAPTSATAPSQIDITKVTCSDLTSATPLDRAAIVMFYWGYAAAKANATTFKTGILQSATHALMTECAGNASEPVLNAMQRINVKAF